MGDEFLHKQFPPYHTAKGEEYMSPKQLTHFRGVLDVLRNELSGEIERASALQDQSGTPTNPDGPPNQETILTLELPRREREHRLITKVDEALSRIESGEYGYCDGCGVEIGLKRLEARPTSTLCIDCKTLEEVRELQRAS